MNLLITYSWSCELVGGMAHNSVNLWFDLKQIATEFFFIEIYKVPSRPY